MSRLLRPEGDAIAVGTFIKSAAPQTVELLGAAGLDFVVLDAEHAPLDRGDIDRLLLAGLGAGLPLLLRPDRKDSALIQSALDCGAAGLLVPHVDTVEDARNAVALARFRGGARGFSGSTRAAGYGTMAMAAAIAAGDRTLVICQIETPQAVENAQAIAAVEGVGGLLVGRADLALAMGEASSNSDAVVEAALAVTRGARGANKIAGMAVGGGPECGRFRAHGVNWFVVSSDQGLLYRGATEAMKSAGAKA